MLGVVTCCWLCFASCSSEDTQPGTTTTPTGTSTGSTSTGGGGSGAGTSSGGEAGTTATGGQGGAGGEPLTVEKCYEDAYALPPQGFPDYDQFGPIVGSHCLGTNHQDITGVERVVFVGDSITVGTPPHLPGDFYRSKVADALAARFGLQPPNLLWKTYDAFNGTSIVQESGGFASCAKWGARTDDLIQDHNQIVDCIPPDKRHLRTLVIMTIGGNDIAGLTQHSIDGLPEADLWLETEQFVQLMREAIEWFYEPGRFPNGVYVVFGNMPEFTDGTGEVEACDVSGLAGFDQPVPYPDQLAEMVVWANEQFVSIACETGSDVIFLLEEFCGHGFNADDPTAPCYRGVGMQNYFDLTCIHPNPTGHQHITDMFMAVVEE